MNVPMATIGGHVCQICRFQGSDLRIAGCGCTIHARCAPISLVCTETAHNSYVHGATVPGGVEPNNVICPACQSSAVTQIHLFGLSMEDIERAVELKKANVAAKAGAKNGKRPLEFDADFQDILAEQSYLLVSQSGGLSSDNELQRTGRWTDEEIAFVDFVLEAFDSGKFPMPLGVKLNEFLGDLLLCKCSRLTKKMKNAKLSVRSYELGSPSNGSPSLDCEMMSTLQEQFLQSISMESTKLELRFHMTKVWRTHFSNLCLQVDCNMLDAIEWFSSLEDMERRASQAEEKIRKARRRRMGLALKADIRTAQSGVFFADMPVKRPDTSKHGVRKRAKKEEMPSSCGLVTAGGSSSTLRTATTDTSTVASSDDGSEADFIASMLDIGADHVGLRSLAPSEDFANMFDELDAEDPTLNLTPHPSAYHHVRNNCGPFLEEIVSYMETNALPFEHVDVWVPSLPPKGQGKPGELRLFHAGHATRSDLDPALYCQMHEYGEYSIKFSFASGVGLPGRVYATGEPSWECQIDEADPTLFVRAGGAKVYGIKTGLAIPVTTAVIGRMVVSMYSTRNMHEDPIMIQRIAEGLAMYAPEPKWKLVVDLGTSTGSHSATQSSASMTHYKHSRPGSVGVSNASAQLNQLGLDLASAPESDLESNLLLNESAPPASSGTNATLVVPPKDANQHIASLLGDYMPLSTAGGEGAAIDLVFSHFMSLRLLLLRSSARCSAEENEMLDIIKNSFRGYSKDNRRSDKELAFLLAKDWQFLTAAMEPKKPAAQSIGEYRSHVMAAPAVNTLSSTGAPAAMPSSLSYVEPTKVSNASQDSGPPTRRRISSTEEAEASYRSINVVDEMDEI